MAQKHTKPQDVTRYYERLDGEPEAKLKKTARHFGITVTSAKRQLRFWWSGPRYLREFPLGPKKPRKQKWDVSTKALLAALNKHGSIAKTARAFRVSPITLTKMIKERDIERVWVEKDRG